MEDNRNFQRQMKPKQANNNIPRDNYKWELCFPPTSRLGVTIKDYNGSVYTHMSLLSRQENKRAVSISFRADEMELLITSIPEIEKCLAECARAIRRPPRQPIEGYTTIDRPESEGDADDEMSPPIPRTRRPETTRKMRKVFTGPEASTEVAQPAKKRKPKQAAKKGITQRLVEEDSDESSIDEAPPSKRRSNGGKQHNAPARRIIHSEPSSSDDDSSDEEAPPPTKPATPPRSSK